MTLDRKQDVLRSTSFGERVAEDERESLASYFVETDQWRKVWDDEVDVVFAHKGGGKSAIYSMLVSRENELFDRNILIAAGENPTGSTAFKEMEADPPTSEAAFVGIWKLYFLALMTTVMKDYDFKGKAIDELSARLGELGLVDKEMAKRSLVKKVMDYVSQWIPRAPGSAEATVALDPATGAPIGVTGKITFAEPTQQQSDSGFISIDSLYELADQALNSAGFKIWLLLDRLDVAFAESHQLEENALRGLFRAYMDVRALPSIGLKIFLRTDIWRSITASGFREASHITKEMSIAWTPASLMQLVMRRLLKSEDLREYYGVDADAVLSSAADQVEVFGRVFPPQVELGSRKSTTFDWCLARTRDGQEINAPRELIHLMTSAKDSQMQRYETGQANPSGESLFDRQAFKDALPAVSDVRLTKTVFAEYPNLKSYLELLEGQKTHQSLTSLAAIWSTTDEDAKEIAARLVEIGFFEQRGEQQNRTYWVPFMYRPALKMVQGSADGVASTDSDEDEDEDATEGDLQLDLDV